MRNPLPGKAGSVPLASISDVDASLYKGDKYQDPRFAEYYDAKHKRTLVRRASNWRERRIMAKALSALAPFETVLDLPSGAGRFLPTLARFHARVLASDRSAAMLKRGMRHDPLFGTAPLRFVTSVDKVSLRSNVVDVVFCARLIHHVPEHRTRTAVLAELARLARKGVVISFFDAGTFKHRRRLRKQRHQHRISKRYGIRREDMVTEAHEAGLTLVGMYALLPCFAELTAAVFQC